jgi:hypothetical protein
LLQFPSISAAKEIMRFKGYGWGNCRGPLDVLTPEQKKNLYDQLAKVGFLEKGSGL